MNVTSSGGNLQNLTDLEQFRFLFDQISDGVAISDKNGVVTNANATLCCLLGFEKSVLTGQNLTSLFESDDDNWCAPRPELSATELQHVNRRMRTASGQFLDVHVRTIPFGNHEVMTMVRTPSHNSLTNGGFQNTEAIFTAAFENSAIGMGISSLEGLWMKVNPELCHFFGYAESELLGTPFRALGHPDDGKRSEEHLQKLLSGEEDTFRIEKRYIHKTGKTIWGHLMVTMVKNPQGQPQYFMAQIENLSAQKNTINKLYEREEQLRLFIQHSPVALAMFDNKMRYIITSERWKSDYSLGEQNLIGRSHYAVFPEIGDEWKAVHQRCLEGAIETCDKDLFVRQDGSQDWVRWEIHPWKKAGGEIGGIIMFTEVITEKIAVEVENEKTRYLLNERVKELSVLYHCARLLQSPQTPLDLIVTEIVKLIPQACQFPEACKTVVEIDGTCHSPDGQTEFAHSLSSAFETRNHIHGKITVGYPADFEITGAGAFLPEEQDMLDLVAELLKVNLDRRDESTALQHTQANLRTLLDSTNVSFLLLDTDMTILSFNKAAEAFAQAELGVSQIENIPFLDYLPDSRRQQLEQIIPSVLSGNAVEQEVNYPQRNGTQNWYHSQIKPIKNQGGEVIGIIVAVSDITAQKQMGIQREKMTSDLIHRIKDLEQFAYIVSHNLRAPVANIKASADLLKANDLEPGEAEQLLNGLGLSAHNLDEVIQDLTTILKMKRNIREQRVPVRFQQLTDDIAFSISDLIEKEQVTISTNFADAEGMPAVKSYLHSIFYNLISNAIKYKKPDVPPHIQISSGMANGSLVIKFEDNGSGMDLEKYGNQLFGLYKRFHHHLEGKGVGLFMVKTQVESLGGSISVSSKVNVGTTFSIEFPVRDFVLLMPSDEQGY